MKLLWFLVLIALAAGGSGCSLTSASEPNVESTDSFVQKQLIQHRV